MRITVVFGAALLAAPAVAQDADDRLATIQVVGIATVETPPDRARLAYWVTGEGKTPDEATTALAAKHRTIRDGLQALLGRDTHLAAGDVSVSEVRSPQCAGPGDYDNRPRLSEGACAVTGYIATLQGTGRTTAVGKAATAAGLAARLGARDARVPGFELSDRNAAQRRATAAAIADARAKAEAMATGAGVRLGELVMLNDQIGGGDIMVTGSHAEDIGRFRRTPAPAAPPAVAIDITPRPIETQARVYARFAIAR